MYQENLYKLTGYVTEVIPQLINATFGTLFFMCFVLDFMSVNGKKMETTLNEYIPMEDANDDRIGHEIETMVISNAVCIPLIAILQGIIAVIIGLHLFCFLGLIFRLFLISLFLLLLKMYSSDFFYQAAGDAGDGGWGLMC